jgi:transposase
VHAFRKDGMKGLHEHHSGGRRAKLTDEQMQCLTADLQKLPRVFEYPEREWRGKLLAQHVEDCYGIKLSVRQCQRIIHKLVGTKTSVNSNSMRQQF